MSLMLYKRGGHESVHGVDCETRVVDGPDEEEAARAEGFASYGEVIAGVKPSEPAKADPPAQAPANDSELQAAAELLAEVSAERDEARDRLADALKEIEDLKAQIAPFDGDNDGKPGGRKKLGIKAETSDGG